MDLKEIRCEGVDWILLAQDKVQWQALVTMVMKQQFPLQVGEVLDQLNTISFS
jgi:hypothetical protein